MRLIDIQTEIGDLCERGEAIVAKAEQEDRELTKLEREELDRIYGTDRAPGKLSALKEEESRLVRMDQERKEIAARRAVERGTFKDGPLATKQSPEYRGMNSHGQQVVMLTKDQKLVDFHSAQGHEGARAKGIFGEFVKAAVCGVSRSTPSIVATQLTSSNSAGGYVTPPGWSSYVQDLARANAVVGQAGAMFIPMQSSDLHIATVIADPDFQVKSEGSAFTESSIVFGQKKLQAFTIGTYLSASRELIEDSPNFSQIFEQVLSRSLAAELDRLTLQGTGSQEPLGILNDPSLPSDAVASASNPTWLDLGDAAGQIRAQNHEPGAILCSPKVHTHLLQSRTGNGTDSAAAWLGISPALEGKSLLVSSNMPDDQVLVGDFSNLAWAIRTQPTIEVSTVAGNSFQRHEVAIKCVWRGDWVILDHSAFHCKTGIALA